MPLCTGERLDPCEILAPIGAGGMGEVYRARDTQAGARGRDSTRIGGARFGAPGPVRARSQGAGRVELPNLAQIYGIEESDGASALVMELVPWRTLKGPLPLATTLNYARQIAAALKA